MNSEWLQAMQILAEHKLPISIVGTDDLQKALDHVASILQSHKLNLQLDYHGTITYKRSYICMIMINST